MSGSEGMCASLRGRGMHMRAGVCLRSALLVLGQQGSSVPHTHAVCCVARGEPQC